MSEEKCSQNGLTCSHLQMASVLSDVFEKSTQDMMKNPQEKPTIEQLIHKRMKAKVPDLDSDLIPEQAEKIWVINYDLVLSKEDLEQIIRQLVRTGQTKPNASQVQGRAGCFQKSVQMAILDTAGKFCSWGIGSVQARISKGGIFLKPFLAQIANASEKGPGVNSRNKAEAKSHYGSLHRLVVSLYQLLLKQEEYPPAFQGMSELRNPDKAQPFQMPSALHKNRN